MDRPLRSALVTPISPSQPGNGLAHRARFWQAVLRGLGPSETVLVPVSGSPRSADDLVVPVVRPQPHTAYLPARARPIPESLGRTWGEGRGPYDVVLALRAYTGPFALGLAAGTDSVVVVDLDDDDADLLAALGEYKEAARFATLVEALRHRSELVSVGGFAGSACVPNSVQPPSSPVRASAGGLRVLMVANFAYAPNLEGAHWLVQQVLPLVEAEVPTVELSFVGPSSEALGRYGRGYQPDLARMYSTAAVAVVPLHNGSGSRIKAIEALAHRVPVVGTTVGLAGLDVVDGVHCLVRDDPAAFAQAVVRLLGDSASAEALAARAAVDLLPRYSWDRVAASAREVLRVAVHAGSQRVYDRALATTVTETQDGLVVMDEETFTAHHLNPFAAAVLTLAEGGVARTVLAEQATALFSAAPAPTVAASVDEALAGLERSGLLVRRSAAGQGQ